MKLPSVKDKDIINKRVLIRADLDVGSDINGGEERLKTLLETLLFTLTKAEKTIVLGHRGRPGGKVVEELSLEPVSKKLEKLLIKKIGKEKVDSSNLFVMENLRFSPGEEGNDLKYAETLAEHGDVYINEAFSASHRKHSSIVSLPKLLPHAVGIHFQKEIENLSKFIKKPKKPVIVIVSGIKKDKLEYLEDLKKIADKVLIAGRLPEYLEEERGEKLMIANLNPDKEDITVHSIEKFEKEIRKAKTIFIAGPPGKFEDEGHALGTKRILTAIAKSDAFKVAGGGDTQKAIKQFNLIDKFDWISSGGGASLEFLAKGTLPGIEALIN